MRSPLVQLLTARRFAPLFITQFLGAFNDNLLKSALGILVTFVYAFSAFSNFGILARQRCQVLPFFIVLLCLPEWHREGVITVEEALAGRDTSADLLHRTEDAVDPYSTAVEAKSVDPYAGAEPAVDPYRHIRVAPPRER